MPRALAVALYWLAAITIALGAYGHGFVGVVPIREAVAASNLDAHAVRVIWIVWYFVSGAMLAFGLLLFWVWAELRSGSARRSGAALVVGAFYLLFGAAAYVYSGREPFWLLFVIQGLIVIASTLALGRARS